MYICSECYHYPDITFIALISDVTLITVVPDVTFITIVLDIIIISIVPDVSYVINVSSVFLHIIIANVNNQCKCFSNVISAIHVP